MELSLDLCVNLLFFILSEVLRQLAVSLSHFPLHHPCDRLKTIASYESHEAI